MTALTSAIIHDRNSRRSTHNNKSRQTLITIYNSITTHSEVLFSILSAIQSITSDNDVNVVQVQVYMNGNRFGMLEFMEKVVPGGRGPTPTSANSSNIHWEWDDYKNLHLDKRHYMNLLILTTCYGDVKQKRVADILLEQRHSSQSHQWLQVLCIIHDSRKVPARAIYSTSTKLLALSPHVAKSISSSFSRSGAISNNESPGYMVPVFNVPNQLLISDPRPYQYDDHQHHHIVIQGLVKSYRRNYKQLFTQIQKKKGTLEKLKIVFDIVGKSDINNIPAGLRDTIVRNYSELNYTQYYSQISQSAILLPIFASNIYIKYKASSSIGTSFIAGVPILAKPNLIEAYTYIEPKLVWEQGINETDVEAVIRLISNVDKFKKDHIVKVGLIKEFRNQWIKQNGLMFKEVIKSSSGF